MKEIPVPVPKIQERIADATRKFIEEFGHAPNTVFADKMSKFELDELAGTVVMGNHVKIKMEGLSAGEVQNMEIRSNPYTGIAVGLLGRSYDA